MTEMTEDHRVASANERARIARSGQALRDGEVRICGMLSVALFLLGLMNGKGSTNVHCYFHRTKSC
jgi:hypothetical protein